MKKRYLSVVLGWLLLATPGYSRQDLVVCGTNREKRKEELHLHRQAVKARQKQRLSALRAAPVARDIGDIALIDDADGVVARRNEFNLDLKTVTFQPATPDAASYRFQTGGDTYDALAATNGAKIEGFEDDDTRLITLPFAFPFYGNSHQKVYINSDGNLTFLKPDTATSERSLGRMTSGPARISPLFRDLDPSRSAQGVRVLSEPGRVAVSWVSVPEYQEFGVAPQQTFQVRLFSDGRIEFAYAGISTLDAVVGISPGSLQGTTAVVSFVSGSSQEFTSTIAERFGGATEVDIVTAAQKFYATHEDSYDYLVIFNNLGIPASLGAIAYEITVRNDRTGYGDIPADSGEEFGSRRRLQALMNMGPLSLYPSDINGKVGNRGQTTGDTPLTVLAHEAGHLFLAFASVREPNNPDARPMLGAQEAHWSFNFNSEASVLEGNRIRDNGAGTTPRFITTGTVEGFSPLDQYLMGFRAAEEVAPPDVFLVTNSNRPASKLPQVGVTISGNRRDILVNEIVQAEGRRTPDYTVAQRRFRFAFLLVTPQGQDPSQAELDKLETFRREFENFYHQAASGRAWADATLRRSMGLSTFPAAGVMAGETISATLTLEKPAETELTVTLETQNGAASVPPSVTIPAGGMSVPFQITGIRAGVEELAAKPADGRYETAYSRIQVLASRSELRLEVVSGGDQGVTPGFPLVEPITVRVLDINNLPYPGLRVQASVSDSGTVAPPVGTTDLAGRVQFDWTPGTGPVHQLTATLEGAPGSSVAVALPAAPAFSAAGVVNAASFTQGLSPGGFASIFGGNLAAGSWSAAAPPYPLTLAGVQVRLGGRSLPLHFVSDAQINFLVPLDVAPGVSGLEVSNVLGSSIEVPVTVTAASPGVFFDTATNYGAILVHRTGKLTTETPAVAEDFLEIYCTGLGAVRPHPTIPGLQETVLTPQVFLAGSVPLRVDFSGLVPSFPGLYQINALIPAGVPSGDQPLTVEINGILSNEVKVRIQ